MSPERADPGCDAARTADAAAVGMVPPQSAKILRTGDYRRMRWKNGAGWTLEVHRVPDAQDWCWRVSLAEVETDAPFSAYPGVERELVLLEGNGMRLRFDDGAEHVLSPPHGGLRFSGDRPLVGELIDGSSRDFNLMWRRGAVDAQLWQRPLVGAMVVFADPGETWVLHLLAGQAHFSCGCGLGGMEAGDTAILPGGDTRARFALDGNGEMLLARVATLAEVGGKA